MNTPTPEELEQARQIVREWYSRATSVRGNHHELATRIASALHEARQSALKEAANPCWMRADSQWKFVAIVKDAGGIRHYESNLTTQANKVEEPTDAKLTAEWNFQECWMYPRFLTLAEIRALQLHPNKWKT